ncbi:MAG: PhoH family protein [Calditrichaeota bacterium]|nr:MAG: PhoH family protein [Calditrichota bacterium]
MQERKIDIGGIDQTVFLGFGDKFLKKISAGSPAKIVVRGSQIIIKGEPQELDALERIFTELILLYNRNQEIRESDIDAILAVTRGKNSKPFVKGDEENNWEAILYTKESVIKPRTRGQARYFEIVKDNDLVFVIGPAGTGKTYLAVAMAVAQLRDKQVSRIVLARPAVEAGESLGYLPGDLLEKVDPYLRPLYDALGDMIPSEKLQRYLETRIIEVVPLAYMRGRTLNNAFVILDEAQNTTPKQMKMFLTRLGINSKAIVTGDITQIDLPAGAESGLVQVQSILADVPGVAFVYLQESDVVRHRLVRDIIKAYESYQNSSKEATK